MIITLKDIKISFLKHCLDKLPIGIITPQTEMIFWTKKQQAVFVLDKDQPLNEPFSRTIPSPTFVSFSTSWCIDATTDSHVLCEEPHHIKICTFPTRMACESHATVPATNTSPMLCPIPLLCAWTPISPLLVNKPEGAMLRAASNPFLSSLNPPPPLPDLSSYIIVDSSF